MSVSQGLFASPLPTPIAGDREETLQGIKEQLKARLDLESKARAVLLEQLESQNSNRDEVSKDDISAKP